VRLFTWNLDAGRATDSWRPLQAAIGADLVLLQEAPAIAPSDRAVWMQAPGRGWGSAIVVADGRLTRREPAGFAGWAVGAQWVRNDGSVHDVYSVHTPGRGAPGSKGSYVKTTIAIVEHILDCVGRSDVIIGGDFNIGIGVRAEGETLETRPADRKALDRFREWGLVSAWQASHPGKALPQTLRWKKDRGAAPYHCDGFFVRPHVAERTLCEVLHSSLLHAKSDHYPVAAWVLAPGPAAGA
jgi:endonuclease/exonuclease/phosphatase family metal-dependent hydrolase